MPKRRAEAAWKEGDMLWLGELNDENAEAYRKQGISAKEAKHPVMLLYRPSPGSTYMVVALMTSLGGRTLEEHAHAQSSRKIKRAYVPIYPHPENPLNKLQLHMSPKPLRKSSYIKTTSIYSLPGSVLRPFGEFGDGRGERYHLDDASVAALLKFVNGRENYQEAKAKADRREAVQPPSSLTPSTPPRPFTPSKPMNHRETEPLTTHSPTHNSVLMPTYGSIADSSNSRPIIAYTSRPLDVTRHIDRSPILPSYRQPPAAPRSGKYNHISRSASHEPSCVESLFSRLRELMPSRETTKSVLAVLIVLGALGGAGYGLYALAVYIITLVKSLGSSIGSGASRLGSTISGWLSAVASKLHLHDIAEGVRRAVTWVKNLLA